MVVAASDALCVTNFVALLAASVARASTSAAVIEKQNFFVNMGSSGH